MYRYSNFARTVTQLNSLNCTNAEYKCWLFLFITQLFDNSSFRDILKFHYFFNQIFNYMSMQSNQYTKLCSSTFHPTSHTITTIYIMVTGEANVTDVNISSGWTSHPAWLSNSRFHFCCYSEWQSLTHVCELLQLYSLDIKLKLKALQLHVQNLFHLSHLLKNAADMKTDAGYYLKWQLHTASWDLGYIAGVMKN